MRRERGLSAIIAYKVIKGVVGLACGLTLLAFIVLGVHQPLQGLASHLRRHTGVWSLELAKWVVRASTHRGLWIVTVALLGDALFTLVEGWALFRGKWWGPWLVVVATFSFVPFEVASLSRHVDVVRACVLLVNLGIVAYLARNAIRERRKSETHGGPSSDGFHRPGETQ